MFFKFTKCFSKEFLILMSLFLSFYSLSVRAQLVPSIIPKPVSITMNSGNFDLDNSLSIHYNPKHKNTQLLAIYLQSYLKQLSGKAFLLNKPSNKKIEFLLTKGMVEEGYQMKVSPSRITIKASSDKGFFYGIQSLIQCLPAIRTNDKLLIPAMEITDYPRFQWRGMMLDVSRHFFAPELVKQFIDLLASYKMNVFHWHLVDGAGWRLEIKKYPKLTQQAAWRIDDRDNAWNWSAIEFNADRSQSTYGGFYTQEQVKEIVAYAKARNITVVPEIEMPGHSEAAMAAYPELSCNPGFHYGQNGSFFASKVQSNYCAGNEAAFVFLQNVLTEVVALFPSTYIHLGGDEVDKTSWESCPKCQARMQKEQLANENELQSYFMRRMEKFLISKKRKMIGWDEILEGGLAPEATVMSWRGESGGIQAAKMGHQVIMSPEKPCYFDHYQADPETEPLAIGGFNTLKKVYEYEPIPKELDAKQATFVLGAQANLWTEYISTNQHVLYMILPRMLALSEVVWSDKTQRNWIDFNQRLQFHQRGFDEKGIVYSKGNFKVAIQPLSENNSLTVKLETDNPEAAIYYTLDGTEPTISSYKYANPLSINTDTQIKAVSAIHQKIKSIKASEQSFTFNKATAQPIELATTFSKYYPANGTKTLVDGIRGTQDISRDWLGFNSSDLVATITFSETKTIQSMSLGAIQNWKKWIFLPQWVKFEVSENGVNFKEIETVYNTIAATEKSVLKNDFKVSFPSQKVQFIRITAKNLGLCPEGHPGEKKSAWLFVDEIIVN